MTPRLLFEQLWARGDELALLYENLVIIGIPQARADELLRAEWVARLAALDLYVHELLASRMVGQFEGAIPASPGFNRFRMSAETLWRIANAESNAAKVAAFDLDVRAQISHLTFQMPDKIADAVRYTSEVQLWKAVAQLQNPTAVAGELKVHQATLKTTLTSMVERRNKIAHEGDLGPTVPREKLPIDLAQIELVRVFVRQLVDSIELVMIAHDDAVLAAASSGEEAEADSAGSSEGEEVQSEYAQGEGNPTAEPTSTPIEPVWINRSTDGELDVADA